ncbi:hypothetical protein [Nocardia stercoris]|nr:hypothetical protein [Nocardia stercoris]
MTHRAITLATTDAPTFAVTMPTGEVAAVLTQLLTFLGAGSSIGYHPHG